MRAKKSFRLSAHQRKSCVTFLNQIIINTINININNIIHSSQDIYTNKQYNTNISSFVDVYVCGTAHFITVNLKNKYQTSLFGWNKNWSNVNIALNTFNFGET